MARVEWSEAELNATLGELSGGNSAARGSMADAPPLGTMPNHRVIHGLAASLSCPNHQGSDLAVSSLPPSRKYKAIHGKPPVTRWFTEIRAMRIHAHVISFYSL